jgi:hypothetical protein
MMPKVDAILKSWRPGDHLTAGVAKRTVRRFGAELSALA